MITRNVSSKNPDLVVILREDGGRFVSRLSITSPSCVALTEPLVVVQLVSQDVVAFSVVCKVVATSTGTGCRFAFGEGIWASLLG